MAYPRLMPAQAQQLCPGLPNPSVAIELHAPAPSFDTRRLADMKVMSRSGLGEHQEALGLYKAELRTGLRFEYAQRAYGPFVCLGVRSAVVRVEFTDRKIYLARELQPESCRYAVTLAHEHEHARIDDVVFERELPKLKDAMVRAIREIGAIPVPTAEVEANRADIKDRLWRALERELGRIAEIRRDEQSRIDTPESYRREAERCPREPRVTREKLPE